MDSLKGIGGNGPVPLRPAGNKPQEPRSALVSGAPEETWTGGISDQVLVGSQTAAKPRMAEKTDPSPAAPPRSQPPAQLAEIEGYLVSPGEKNSQAAEFGDLGLNGPSQMGHGLFSLSGQPLHNPRLLAQE